MRKILIFLSFVFTWYGANAQKSANVTDTILTTTIERSCPGGFIAFNKYIQKNCRPPAIAYENRKVGTTYISFIIEPDGSVSNVCSILLAGYGMDKETVRVINSLNNWIPSTIDGKPVRTFCRAAVQYFGDFDKHEMWVRAKQVD